MAVTGKSHENWSSRSAFILAAVGSAVGLGNMWRFPAEAGENGGGAFVLFYIFCVLLIGLPVLLSEVLVGRHGQANAPESVRRVARDSNAPEGWGILGSMGVFAAFLILSFYCVVGGWVVYYIGVFAGDLVQTGLSGGAFEGRAASDIEGLLPGLFGDGGLMVGLNLGFLAVTMFFVSRGVSSGIEWVAVYLMPIFFLLFVGITVYGAFTGNFGEAVAYLFTFDFSKLTGEVMLAAVGQAFFSLSLGVAGMMTYGAYANRDTNLGETSGIIAAADTGVAMLAGLAIFPIVFAAGLSASAGPGLMFQSLPIAFQAMPFGSLIGLAFFVMVFFAALTSSVSLLEAPTAYVFEKFSMSRPVATLIVGLGAAILGVLSSLSFNEMAEFYPLGFIPLFAETNFFDTLDGVTAKLFMPIGAILTCIFVGWVADAKLIDDENGLDGVLHQSWRVLVRFVCPLALTVILFFGLFG
ncbi:MULTISPECIES: sodium-dependent transporter [Altererythrobacter]|uniref:NSS family neurotransmitter:Na+ symporter n=1 Tax=Altererythrobacter ishigakiensis TaxID=476157 RepID=A0A562UWA2_9SPHN|nr:MULTISPECIES: sodium-dependent transporter [Altererythrobacter]MBO6609193.1 sodium-dependent transporter [Altererythrobacter sp.]MBO6641280.1 sodium-dependent transporter [Altererythrobacter sp.]MBO6708022.1 sodium-dependent transporter [Altererythrobacter sp.]MDX1702784.1 sodium-dependent transporter [Altererythrobacter ishigakiensis]TWJ09914.1 NSS family neurotransmitter:Na+ symporter [Altererythrobacter ishigakiensis]